MRKVPSPQVSPGGLGGRSQGEAGDPTRVNNQGHHQKNQTVAEGGVTPQVQRAQRRRECPQLAKNSPPILSNTCSDLGGASSHYAK